MTNSMQLSLARRREAAFRKGVEKATGGLKSELVPVEDGHVHHWKLDPPKGAKSWGECRCGSRREFANSMEHAPVFNA